MNVLARDGEVHHLVDQTGRLLCGRRGAPLDLQPGAAGRDVTCPACLRLLADDVRRAGQSAHDSED